LYVATGGETVETFDIAGGAFNFVGTTSFHRFGRFDSGNSSTGTGSGCR
jgi:hypothetical protein